MPVVTFGTLTIPSSKIGPIESVGPYALAITIEGSTESFGDVVAIRALQGQITITPLATGYNRITTMGGTKASLTVDGTVYANCYIERFEPAEKTRSNLGLWEFTIRFVQETYSAS